MIDIAYLRNQPELIARECARRNLKIDLEHIRALDVKRRELITTIDQLRNAQHAGGDSFTALSREERDVKIGEMKELKARLLSFEDELKINEEELNALLLTLPNISHDSVPQGRDETENAVIKTWGDKPSFLVEPVEHFKVRSVEPLIDLERGSKVAGARFWYLKGLLARLEFGLMQYAFQFYSSKGFCPMIPPMLVREDALWGTGFFPAERNEIYRINSDTDDLFLIGTAEVALAAYHMNETVSVRDGSPLKYVGFSGCFRREAGAYGKDLKGILRGHQFNKVEMFVFCTPTDSWALHEYLLQCAEEFVQSLGIHYQVLNMCTGDIGLPNAKKYDIECWMPGQGRYRETHSCSNDTDFQARRLGTKYKDEHGKRQFVHTLNNTGCADRMVVAIIENYQQQNGEVVIPEVLRPFCGFDRLTLS